MRHTSGWKVVLMVAAWLATPGFAQDRPPQALPGWGQAVDPDRDCRFQADGGRLTITVPAKLHDLSAESGNLNAPRVLKDIEGDFIAQVKVSGNVTHAGDRAAGQNYPYHGAGLLLWQDERNYVRLERAAINREDGVLHYVNFELRKDGQPFNSPSAKIPDQECYLRVERKGGRVCGAVSPDGTRWHYLNPLPVHFPARLKVGVAAINTSTERFTPIFREMEVYKKEPNRGP